MCPEIVPMGFGKETQSVIGEIKILLSRGSSLLAHDVVFNTIGKNAEVTDINGKSAPYVLVRGHKGEKQLVELFTLLKEGVSPIYLGYEWEFSDLLLFIDKDGNMSGPGVQ